LGFSTGLLGQGALGASTVFIRFCSA
jgi:hypothetical protein